MPDPTRHPSGHFDPSTPVSLLDRIVSAKWEEIEVLEQNPAYQDSPSDYVAPSDVSGVHVQPNFAAALRRPAGSPIRVIAECKKASPSMGLIKPDYDPARIAITYRDCGAQALSVLTDRSFFQGCNADLMAARKAELPIIRKDFILSPLQIREAREIGASAILLIVRILSAQQLVELQHAAREWGLHALVEIHNEAEAEAAMQSGARIIGINHRDLDTLEMDLGLTARIAPQIRSARPDCILVGESGVESPGGLARVDPYVDAVLIGTALMKSADIAATWRTIFSNQNYQSH